jgi:thymidylate synthase (FAD)
MSKVNLIGLTKPSAYTECNTAQELVAYAARVSNPVNQNNTKTAGKLVKYLINNEHWSPLEMVHIVMEIKTTRDISRQILRHRSFSFQEFSQRYAVSDSFVCREARLQENRDPRLQEDWNWRQIKVKTEAVVQYKWALENGIAKEQARAVLPEGMTETTLYMAGTLRSWIHYCQLRMDKATQKEHRAIALKCWDIIGAHFPDIIEALKDEV